MSNNLDITVIDLNNLDSIEAQLKERAARLAKEDEIAQELARSVANYLKNNALGKPGMSDVKAISSLVFTMGIGLALASGVQPDTLVSCAIEMVQIIPDRNYARSFLEPFGIDVDEFVQRVYGRSYDNNELQ